MATEKQIAANKRNAQKSTGPRTQKGKARSRMNALRHSLSSVVAEPAVFYDKFLSSDNANSIARVQNRLQQICSERVKILSAISREPRHSTTDGIYIAVKKLAALERYSRHSYSELKKFTTRSGNNRG
jgi:hypothetical protein